jgi:ankyrin repeat protein
LRDFPEEQRLTCISEKDFEGDTVLHLAINHPEQFKYILDALTEPQRFALIKEKNKNGNTVLHLPVKQPELFKYILDALTEPQRVALIKEKNKNGDTILHLAMNQPELFKYILDALTEPQRVALIKEKYEEGDTILHLAIKQPELFKYILDALPEPQRVALIKEKNEEGDTVLDKIFKNSKASQAILEALPESMRLEILLTLTRTGKATFLHQYACNKPDIFKLVLNLLPEHQYYQAVSAKDIYGAVVPSYVARHVDGLKILAEKIPHKQLLSLLHEDNDQGIDTVYFTISFHPLSSLKQILSFYSEAEYLAMVKTLNIKGSTIFHFASEYPEKLEIMLEKLEDSASRMNVLMVKNQKGLSVTQRAENNPDALKVILKILPLSTYTADFLRAFEALPLATIKSIISEKMKTPIEAIESIDDIESICKHLERFKKLAEATASLAFIKTKEDLADLKGAEDPVEDIRNRPCK